MQHLQITGGWGVLWLTRPPRKAVCPERRVLFGSPDSSGQWGGYRRFPPGRKGSPFHQSRVTVIASTHLATSLLRCLLISLRKLFPCGIVPSKFSATVCPISASVSRTPRFTPAPPPGEYAKIGTYSREWSVVAQRGSGSHPWSAVIISMSERLRRGKNAASMPSNSSSDLANPSTSFLWPYSMSKSTRLQKINPLLRS